CKTIQVSNEDSVNCTSDFTYTVDSTSLTAMFSDKSYGNPDTWEWDFGDESTSTQQNPSHTYNQSGYYMIVLHAINSTTNCESYKYDYINVSAGNNGIQAIFTYFIDTTDTGAKPEGNPVDMIGIGHGGGAQLSWSYGDSQVKNSNEVNTTTLTPTHVYQEPGKYECCLTISDPIIDQSDTYCDTIEIAGTAQSINNKLNNQFEFVTYPNPMKSYTNIKFKLPKTSEVSIAIYDAIGNKVADMINTYKPAGEHHILWKNSKLSSGIYYIKLTINDTSVTRKLIIQK
ncbi:MAG: PKD domain-containing protein, partial [Bacteroidota bacterium]|nr:PKD domain-containing protein [Bacteroidota bacterium]